MDRAEFESKLSDYVRGELSAAEAQQIETYLTEHPEAADDLEAVRTVLELSADIGTDEPPDALFAAARTNALKAIQAADKRQRTGFWQRLPRPMYLSGLAAVLAGVVFGVLWQGSTSAWAEVVAEVRKLHSVRVEGWFRGEKGEQVPVQQWIRAPHFFRSAVGTGAARREAVVNDAKMRVYMDGVWYGEDRGAESAWSIDKVAEQLALPGSEQLEPWTYQIEREDREPTVLFSIWRRSSLGTKTPSDIRYEVEVDAQTRLPSHARVYLDVGQEDWELVSELNYLDYNTPLADELFMVTDDAVPSFTDSVRSALPFEQILDPFVPWKQAIYMPLDGMDIIVHPPSDDPSKGIQGSTSHTVGGITRHEFHRTPLAEIVRRLGKMPVEPRIKQTIPSLRSEIIRILWKEPMETPEEKLAKQRYSVRIAYSHSLTPTERVQRLGQRFGFVAEEEERQGTRTCWIFTQDGSEFPTTPPEGNMWTNGKRYRCTGCLLGFAIPEMLENSALNDIVEGYNEDLDEIEMQWDGAAADNPFDRPVDIDVDFSAGWDVALDYLREHFGVAMERVSEPITYEVLVMRPHSEGAK
ncbi:MAG: hypothetical protein J4F35_03070 [Candidatus Latescibacteria bacterium]|nr:hypothetical protein [Candidatus Latescibacterota bacterium]